MYSILCYPPNTTNKKQGPVKDESRHTQEKIEPIRIIKTNNEDQPKEWISTGQKLKIKNFCIQDFLKVVDLNCLP